MPSSLGDEIPRFVDLPAPNLQWKNKYVLKGMDWIALLVRVYLDQGYSQVSESLSILMGDEKNFPTLNKLYHEK